jgi:hypothetical protein
MESHLLDKVLQLSVVSSVSCFLRLGDEGSGFVQVLLDFRLKSR